MVSTPLSFKLLYSQACGRSWLSLLTLFFTCSIIYMYLAKYLHLTITKNTLIRAKDRLIKSNNSYLILSNEGKIADNRIRVALIKPDAVRGLYHSGYGDEKTIIQRAAKHWGPIGLFHAHYFLTDYYIIYIDHADLSTSQWAEPLTDCGHKGNRILSRPLQVPPRPTQGYLVKGVFRTSYVNITKIAVNPSSIPWEKYDIVLSFSPAVSSDIILKYPSTIWAYWIVEGCQRSYIQSKQGNLVHGWDLFMTQDFNLLTNLPKNVIEFPLTFDYHSGLSDLLESDSTDQSLGSSKKHTKEKSVDEMRSGILLLPSHVSAKEWAVLDRIEYLDLKQNVSKKIPLTRLHGTTPHSMSLHLQKKYAIIWNRKGRGNALAEAWSGGLLVLGYVDNRVINREILRISGCEFKTIEQLVKKIIELEQNEQLFSMYLMRQRKLFDMLAFHGPLRELISKGRKIVKRRLSVDSSSLNNITKERSKIGQ